MIQFYALILFTFTSAPVPKTTTDEWLGQSVFPRYDNFSLEDESGKTIGTWTVTAGKVLWANNEKVQLRHSQHPGPGVGYAKKADLVRLDDAVAFFTTKIKENEKDVWAWRYRAVAWTLNGKHEKAIEDLTEALQLDPRAYMYIARGNALLAKKDYDKAIEDYDEAIRLEPNSPTGFSNKGSALAGKKEYEKAIKEFDEAIRIDPKHSKAFYYRGNAWKNLKEYDKAIKDYDDTILIDPKFAPAFDSRGMTWAYKKEYEKAIKDFDEAIRIDPKNVNAHYNMACSYALQSKTDYAINNLRQAFELGYKNFEHVDKDPDFDLIRNEPAFKELIMRYKK